MLIFALVPTRKPQALLQTTDSVQKGLRNASEDSVHKGLRNASELSELSELPRDRKRVARRGLAGEQSRTRTRVTGHNVI